MSRNKDVFNCETCTQRYCDKDKKLPGSIGEAPFDIYEIKGVIATRTCLLPLVRKESFQFITMHAHYKNNHLPYAGGILDQPNTFMEAMQVIEGLVAEGAEKK